MTLQEDCLPLGPVPKPWTCPRVSFCSSISQAPWELGTPHQDPAHRHGEIEAQNHNREQREMRHWHCLEHSCITAP